MATDENRSFVDWGKLDMGALRLKCSEYNLVATGKRPALQARLLKYFQDKRRPDQLIDRTTTNELQTGTTNVNFTNSDNNNNINNNNIDNSNSNSNELIIAEIRALRSEIIVIKK